MSTHDKTPEDALLCRSEYTLYDSHLLTCCFCAQDPHFWAHRPWSVIMKRAAADDVRFLLHIYERMMKSLSELSKWRLIVRSSLYCHCFCSGDDRFLGYPLPLFPGAVNTINLMFSFNLHPHYTLVLSICIILRGVSLFCWFDNADLI